MFTFKNIVLAGVLLLLLVSVAVQGYNMYALKTALPAALAKDHWADNTVTFYTPAILNLVGMALVGVLFVMG